MAATLCALLARCRAVMLDFDGTICDTERAAYQSWHRLYSLHGQRFRHRVWRRMAGNGDGAAIAEADLSRRLKRPLTAEEMRLRLCWKQALADAQPVRAGVTRLLDYCAHAGLPAVVVTSAAPAWVDRHLDRLGLAGRFDAVFAADRGLRRKPHPDLYQAALRSLGVPAGEGLAVEDSAIGIAAAKAASLICVAVCSAASGAGFAVGADLLVTDLDVALRPCTRMVRHA